MQTDIQERCDKIEASYEFMLAYAAQGLLTDEGSQSGKQLREQLARMIEALDKARRSRQRTPCPDQAT